MRDHTGLQIDGLCHAYGAKTALDDVGFSVRPGTFTALLGPNGAGKSTLYHLLTRILKIQRGRVSLFGADLTQQPLQAMAGLGVVFQQSTLDLDLTVQQNLSYFAALHGLPGRGLRGRIRDRLQTLDLADRANEKVRTLNGGHRRRVEIARALLHDPKLLLLDEATVGLDVPSRRAIVDYVHELCADTGLTALWATHLVDEVWPGDDLVVLHQGKVQATGGVSTLLAEHECDGVASLFEHLTRSVEQVA